MNLDELVQELPGEDLATDDDSDVSPEIFIVMQPNYPLVCGLERVEIRGSQQDGTLKVYLHAGEAEEYYSEEDEDDDAE